MGKTRNKGNVVRPHIGARKPLSKPPRASVSPSKNLLGYPTTRDAEHWDQIGAQAAARAQEPGLFLEQHAAPLFYARTKPGNGKHVVFDDERAFWTESGTLPFATVQLNKFRISDWFPRAPGVFWSHRGIRARGFSWRHHEVVDDPVLGRIVNPASKMSLIEEGGMGTIRLRPRRIDNTDCWLATGVTGAQCAGGIPLAIPDALISGSNMAWGDFAILTGQVRYLQDAELEDVARAVHHSRPLLIFVDKIKGVSKKHSDQSPIVLSPVVLFDDGKSSRKKAKRQPSWSFDPRYTFVQFAAGGDRDVDEAASWLEQYATKHNGRIITNFDEQRPTLSDAPLSYQRLVEKRFDRTIIENLHFEGAKLADRIDHVNQEHVMSISVKLGDGTVIHGDLVVANSIRDSFNRVKDSKTNAKLKKLLEQLASEVGAVVPKLDAEKAQSAANDLETLTKEITSAKPRTKWWQLSVEGLKDAATAVKDIGQPILKTIGLLTSLLAAASK